MPLVLIAVGVALVIAAIRGTLQGSTGSPGLLDLLYSDFVGPGNFFAWIAAIGLVGAIGYIKPLRPVSDAFIFLIIIIFILAANKGGKDFFTSFNNQLVTGTQKAGSSLTGALTTGVTNPLTGTGNFTGGDPLSPALDPFQVIINGG